VYQIGQCKSVVHNVRPVSDVSVIEIKNDIMKHALQHTDMVYLLHFVSLMKVAFH